jgi:hypothetical protein
MTSGSYTIGGTTPDYATIAAWDAAVTGNLTGIVEGKCRAVTFDENLIIDAGGFTTTGSFYMKLTYDTGAFHAGVFGGGAVVNPSQDKVEHVFQLDADYTRVVGLEVTDWVGNSSEGFRVNADLCRIEQCMIYGSADINADGVHFGATNLTTYISNCFFGWLGRAAVYTQGVGVNGFVNYVYNCTGVYISSLDGTANCAFGDDLGNEPDSGTWHIKNTYAHVLPSDASAGGPSAFQKGAGTGWGNSTHNASADASASDTNATNYQNNAAVADQLERALSMYRVGENTADDYSGSWEDTWLDTSNPTTPHGSDVGLDIDNADRNTLFRCKLDLVPSATRLRFASVLFQINDLEGFQSEWHKCLRNWVEGEATWNIWSTGNNWTTAGALSHNNDIYDDATTGGLSGENALRSCSIATAMISVGDYMRTTGGALFTKYVQDAIDGASGAPKGDDWIDIMWNYLAGGTTVLSVDSSEDTDGERPYIELYYDTVAAPFDPLPAVGGVLDGNGTDLSSDGYPITVDITGATRDATWDIGCYLFGPPQTLTGGALTQAGVGYDGVLAATAKLIQAAAVDIAGVGYDGVLDPGDTKLIQAAAADIAGVPYDGVVQGADFIPPIIPIQGGWTGEATDIDEEPPLDADYIASQPSPGRVQLLNNNGFEDVFTSADWENALGFTRTLEGGAQEGSYVGQIIGSASKTLIHGQFIDVDPTALYEYSAYMRRTGGTIAKAYLALNMYRTNNSRCYNEDAHISRGSSTYLTADCQASDISCQVAGTANWETFTYSYMRHGINPDDSDAGDEGHLTNDIRLQVATPFSGNTVNFFTTAGVFLPKGTWVRLHHSGSTYLYPTLPSSFFEIPATWTKFSGRVMGMRVPHLDHIHGELRGNSDMWRAQTAKIRAMLLMPYNTVDEVTVQVDDVRFERLDNVTLVPLRPTLDPLASDRHHVRYRYAKDVALGTINLKVRLLVQQDVWDPLDKVSSNVNFIEIASWQHNDISDTPTTVKQTLSGAQADAMIWGSTYRVWLEFEAT